MNTISSHLQQFFNKHPLGWGCLLEGELRGEALIKLFLFQGGGALIRGGGGGRLKEGGRLLEDIF